MAGNIVTIFYILLIGLAVAVAMFVLETINFGNVLADYFLFQNILLNFIIPGCNFIVEWLALIKKYLSLSK